MVGRILTNENRWAEAEQDAHLVLSLDKSNLKALHRRALARKALNNFSGARDGA